MQQVLSRYYINNAVGHAAMIRIIISLMFVVGLLVQPARAQNPPAGPPLLNNTLGYKNSIVADMILSGQNSTPPCVLTDAATIALNAQKCITNGKNSPAYQTVTLTASGHIIGCPSDTPAIGSGILFKVNEGTGPFKVSMAGCYYVIPTLLDTAGNLILSGIANGINEFYCAVSDVSGANGFNSEYDCGSVNTSLGSTSVYAGAPSAIAFCGGPVTTCAATVSVTAGDILAVWVQDCGTSQSCTGTLVGLSSPPISGTGLSGCAKFTNAEGGSNGIFAHWAYCTVGTTNASLTVTASFTASANQISVVAINLHNAAAAPDAGIGNIVNAASGTSTSNTTNGNGRQSNGYILSGLMTLASTTITPATGANVIINSGSNGTLIQSQLAYAPGATFTTNASWSTSTASTMIVIEVLHR
jgi:hypothetical protein